MSWTGANGIYSLHTYRTLREGKEGSGRRHTNPLYDFVYLYGGNDLSMWNFDKESRDGRIEWIIKYHETYNGDDYYTIQSNAEPKFFLDGGRTIALYTWTGSDRQYWRISPGGRVMSKESSWKPKEEWTYLDGGHGITLYPYVPNSERQHWRFDLVKRL